jgi:4-hydroxy-3-methylbut-2-enyl diphosphate reductase
MIVIGGYNIANTKRLAEVFKELQPRTHHIETASELDPRRFAGVGKVGVTAGASTPKWLIDEVMEQIGMINRQKKH